MPAPKILASLHFPIETREIPDWMLPRTEFDATYKGSLGDDNVSEFSGLSNDPNHGDIVYTNGGHDYFSTGRGNDTVTITPNQASSYIDVGEGSDHVNVNARSGNHTVDLGDGADSLYVRGGGHLIVEAGDGDHASDTFEFSSTFSGHADIYQANSTFTDLSNHQVPGDVLELHGSWSNPYDVDGSATFMNTVTHATVTLEGFNHNQVHDLGQGMWGL